MQVRQPDPTRLNPIEPNRARSYPLVLPPGLRSSHLVTTGLTQAAPRPSKEWPSVSSATYPSALPASCRRGVDRERSRSSRTASGRVPQRPSPRTEPEAPPEFHLGGARPTSGRISGGGSGMTRLKRTISSTSSRENLDHFGAQARVGNRAGRHLPAEPRLAHAEPNGRLGVSQQPRPGRADRGVGHGTGCYS